MTLQIIVTNAGRAALVNAQHNGTLPVTVTQVGISPTAIVPTATANVLPGETKRISTIGGAAVADDIMHLLVRDETTDAYTMKSFALYLGDGTLFAIYGQADAIIAKVAPSIMLLAIDVQFADITATSIAFGDTNFINPPATTATPGVVELADDAEAQAMADALRALTPRGLGLVFTAAKIMQKLITVDGAGSGLDADLLDGFEASAFAKLTGAAFTGGVSAQTLSVTGGDLSLARTNNAWGYVLRPNVAGYRNLALAADGAVSLDQINLFAQTVTRGASLVWDAGNDGAGSGLDADLLDGQHGSYYLAAGSYTAADIRAKLLTVDGSGSGLDADLFDGLDSAAFPKLTGANVFTGTNRFPQLYLGAAGELLAYQDTDGGFGVRAGNAGSYNYFAFSADGQARINGSAMWHANNDGAGSGLDADLLDGQQGAWYADVAARLGFTPLQQSGGLGQQGNKIYIGWSGSRLKATVDSSDLGNVVFDVNVADVWRLSNDGSGSGLDADLLDGLESTAFAKLIGAAFTGALSATQLTLNAGDLSLARTNNAWGYVLRPNVAGYRNLALAADGANALDQINLFAQTVTRGASLLWDAGNDGAGSGLDADLLDGQHGSYYADIPGRLGYVPISAASLAAQALDVNGAQMRRGGNQLWGPDNDGSGSGLDADLLDGRHASEFPLMSQFGFGSGYQRLPSGVILQWGNATHADASGGQHIAFPIPFPNNVLNATASNGAGGPPTAFHGTGNYSPTGMTIFSSQTAGVAAGAGTAFTWFAIGY